MPVSFIFNGDITHPTHEFADLFLSTRESHKKVLKARSVDFYSLLPKEPMVIDARLTGWEHLLSKPNVCLIRVGLQDGGFIFHLHSSNIEDSYRVSMTYRDCRLEDPVAKLIAYHTSGTIPIETQEIVEEEPPAPKGLTEEQIQLLKDARAQKNFMIGKALVNKVFPGKKLNTIQGIKSFCTRQINQSLN